MASPKQPYDIVKLENNDIGDELKNIQYDKVVEYAEWELKTFEITSSWTSRALIETVKYYKDKK